MAFAQFDRVPNHYAGDIIQRVKDFRQRIGKRSLAPTRLEIGDLEVLIPRHFGFCFGVERAIHMAFSALEQHPDRSIYLVSEIIHNPLVNEDLQRRGVRFVYGSQGERQIAEGDIGAEDVVLIPAFGTTLEIEGSLQRSGIDTRSPRFRETFDTTCPFVSKVWDRGEELGREGYTIVIHGKFRHEETQATASHTRVHTRTLVVLDRQEARRVAGFIVGELSTEQFAAEFGDKWSPGFDPRRHLERLAVVNQTTMLAEETREVASILRDAMRRRYGAEQLDHHFADTNDTLCYATNWNQNATKALLDVAPDLAVIVGGHNSSNTSHLVEICSEVMPSYLISRAVDLVDARRIRHFDLSTRSVAVADGWMPPSGPVRIAITSGASCPDVVMNEVVERIAGFRGYGPPEIEAGLGRLTVHRGEAVAQEEGA
ncbi:MAG: 4-hydroxy-3-methylbut-2-enyl diphosphate reductase [Gemmatimonadota bacterium]